MVFFDTSAIVAYFLEKDKNHLEAKRAIGRVVEKRMRLLVSDYVLDECITTMLAHAGHADAVKAGEFLLKSNIVEIVWLDTGLKLRAWEYFKRYHDKSCSFTDCTSFVLMKEMGIKHYIAFDAHFRQAGFVRFR
jgi:predicted nucleic acid-binding protein